MRGTRSTRRGLTPQERQVMDRWDGGQSIRRIARELGKPVQRVRNLIIYYDGAAEKRMSDRAMIAASPSAPPAVTAEQR